MVAVARGPGAAPEPARVRGEGADRRHRRPAGGGRGRCAGHRRGQPGHQRSRRGAGGGGGGARHPGGARPRAERGRSPPSAPRGCPRGGSTFSVSCRDRGRTGRRCSTRWRGSGRRWSSTSRRGGSGRRWPISPPRSVRGVRWSRASSRRCTRSSCAGRWPSSRLATGTSRRSGEVVVLVEGRTEAGRWSEDEVRAALEAGLARGERLKTLSSEIARQAGWTSAEVYRIGRRRAPDPSHRGRRSSRHEELAARR